jgi:surface antigen
MKQFFGGVAVMCAVLCNPVSANASASNCVSYVKSVTNFNIMGDAWQWWAAADHVYGRGYSPASGAVMVFSRTGRMHVGHVAVVREQRGPREIIIDQANWHHGRVDRGVSVIDTSESNDWSQVKVEWTPGYYGGPFPITGFIYPSDSPMAGAHPDYDRARDSRPALVEASYSPRTTHHHVSEIKSAQNKGHLLMLAGIPHASMGSGLQHQSVHCSVPLPDRKPMRLASTHQSAKPAKTSAHHSSSVHQASAR